ncbi:dipeptidyl aminopeptidase/acylaminoacyl peptidase [Chitinophaga terrae (ex Kim and Jung 2007)]|uniref:alpha/beta hydrolase family protein n=1 Tax=Chitinophaga terrae (ex Kim and Jung 2007) TaxID=408074 RepID=UPI0027851FC5|nr:prolyl oligopeptidase family serine peptidase [Chitinophaga terrae (ex Kim and Jung 2007)]MDQ0107497.1 dipeptidyl aminopeptidase/acylaminoacyl peptidase [Chitinophaga terrae (ex Kim and Jung 2007)]
MKYILLLVLMFYMQLPIYGQNKRNLDYQSFQNWPYIWSPKISPDGKYVAYSVWSEEKGLVTTIQKTDTSWKMELHNASSPYFTSDSRHVLLKFPQDSIGLIKLGQNGCKTIRNANSFKIPENGDGQWLAYYSITTRNLILENLSTGKKFTFPNVIDYQFDRDGNRLLIQTIEKEPLDKYHLSLMNLKDQSKHTIKTTTALSSNFSFDKTGKQLAFLSEHLEKSLKGHYRLMYYKIGADSASPLVVDTISGKSAIYSVTKGNIEFSLNGEKIFFTITENPNKELVSKESQSTVEIWSYQDDYLPPQQNKQRSNNGSQSYIAVADLLEKKVIPLSNEDDDLFSLETAKGGNAEYILIKTKEDFSQQKWRKSTRPTMYLVSTKNGLRYPIAKESLIDSQKHYSPNGNYVVWYDKELKTYYSYDIKNKSKRDISHNIPTPIYNDDDIQSSSLGSFGIAGWIDNDEAVLIYDRFDIWRIDPKGAENPLNITNGYGRKNNTVLRIPILSNEPYYAHNAFPKHAQLILSAFNTITKDNGFFSIKLESQTAPRKLTMGPYIYYYRFYPYPSFSVNASLLLKARDRDVYILRRMSSEEYPNIYVTSNFVNLHQLSFLHPEKSYNWLSSELVHWTTFDGTKAEGILYKPKDFDPTKKYPIIFYFYEKDSNGLNNYHFPRWFDGQLNIPYMVSNGYIVFDPNIYYKIGDPGNSAYNSVVSAAKFISSYPWADSAKMGIQGHSFGGYEVNYIIAKSKIFKAAMSAAGVSDLVSFYGSIRTGWGVNDKDAIESGQNRLGATLWKNRTTFINNSPIFYADKITTPLLIMHNESDGAVPFSQSVELFTALRRLGKQVWMLQYNGSGHQVEGTENMKDYTTRMIQFFDYYLKDKIRPTWLSKDSSVSN